MCGWVIKQPPKAFPVPPTYSPSGGVVAQTEFASLFSDDEVSCCRHLPPPTGPFGLGLGPDSRAGKDVVGCKAGRRLVVLRDRTA